tara:strand:- start:1306 stop:1725 length:420 start_codon:yes stop_codon:yes gene_type:complete
MEAEMSKKIGWQKYEEMIKSQMSSPFASLLLTNNLNMIDFSEDQEDLDEIDLEMLQDSEQDLLVVPVPENFSEQLSLLTNYECWVGHTNFDITESIKSAVEKTDGVEILKICSRYRFFIGVGKMFNFSEVRKEIESNTL